MVTREDVMIYCAMISAFCALASGFCFDIGKFGTAWALGLISGGSLLAAFMAYLEPNFPATVSTNEHPQDYP